MSIAIHQQIANVEQGSLHPVYRNTITEMQNAG